MDFLIEPFIVLFSLLFVLVFLQKGRRCKDDWKPPLFFALIAFLFIAPQIGILGFYPLNVATSALYPVALFSAPPVFLFYIYEQTGLAGKPPVWIRLACPGSCVVLMIVLLILFLSDPSAIGFQLLFVDGGLTRAARNIVMKGSIAELFMVISFPLYVAWRQAKQDETRTKSPEVYCLMAAAVTLASAAMIYIFTSEWIFAIRLAGGLGVVCGGLLMYKKDRGHKNQEKPSIIGGLPGDAPLLKELNRYLEQEEAWKHKDLRIEKAAIEIGTNRTRLSNLIKKTYQMNFNSLINMYRVEHAKKLLEKCDLLVPIDNIASESGFNSYSCFFRVFEKETGMNPAEWAGRRKSKAKTDS